MNIKHRVVTDYQFITSDKKIVVLKTGTILENHTYFNKVNNELIKVDKDIIDNNTSFFKPIDWKEELNSYIKSHKIPQPAVLTKKLVPFIEDMFIMNAAKQEFVIPQNTISEEEFTFRESQYESKLKRLELREKQLLADQEDISSKLLEFSQKEKGLFERESKLERLEIREKKLKFAFYSD